MLYGGRRLRWYMNDAIFKIERARYLGKMDLEFGLDTVRREGRCQDRSEDRRRMCKQMICEHLYNGNHKELFNLLMTTAHEVMVGSDVKLWDRAVHRLGVSLFSEGIVLLCTEHEAETLKDLFCNIIAHGKPTVENIRYIESLLVSLLGVPHRRGRVLDELVHWVQFGDRYTIESVIGGDLYTACSPERIDKIKDSSTKLIRGQTGDKYKLQVFINSLIPSSRTISPTCFNHMAHCAAIAKLCHSDPKIVTQIHLAIKFLRLHYDLPNVVGRWCKQCEKKNASEDLSTWFSDDNSRPDTPVIISQKRNTWMEEDHCAIKRARVV